MDDLRALPSVESLLQTEQVTHLVSAYGRPATIQAIRTVLDDYRLKYREGQPRPATFDAITAAENLLRSWFTDSMIPVINATGVILHTNLGRAPMSQAALKNVEMNARGYCTLEYDIENGQRGLRSNHIQQLLQRITGAEASFVVNNNAAAVLLILSALARRKRVIISRTQLVEIGGGFRVPAVMQQSGAKLVEIGTTNRVHLDDYQEALEQPAAIVMRAHQSNFKIIGFTSEPPFRNVAQLAHSHGAIVIDDIGSGALLDTARFGLAHEPTVQESIADGADIVCFSGDKLLGGPQAGIILGREEWIRRIRKHPLARALRADKLCLAGLAATLSHYLKDEAEREIPVWKMIAQSPDEIRVRAERWLEIIGSGEIIPGLSTVGGGSLPGETLPTYLFALKVTQPNRFLSKLRTVAFPIVARVESDRVVFDARTVLPEQEGMLLAGIKEVLR